jgi:hypothetical protein
MASPAPPPAPALPRLRLEFDPALLSPRAQAQGACVAARGARARVWQTRAQLLLRRGAACTRACACDETTLPTCRALCACCDAAQG